MRVRLLSVITAIGIGVLGTSASFAAPAAGAAIRQAATTSDLTQKAYWHGGWGWHHGWHHGWGWRGGWHRWAWGGRGWCYYHPYRCGRY
jgi:hypothetical protein